MLIKQLPLKLRSGGKRDVRSQFAALCYRMKRGKIEILLITSRGSKRWIVPKGWPMDGLTPADSAAREAWEEAGVIGKPNHHCIGLYSYEKLFDDSGFPCVAMIYPVKVRSLASRFPEQGQRRRKWFSRKKAAARVKEPELARIIRDFDPRLLN
ncbi:NUDIX hydrolase [Pukyongiella litopenaei]|uniref:NUDIX hydrolase n=1 Tax=Pukyongiella litopenaei TaxID=2605946 RepID=A0A2S0MLJ5_9RHOB|nr:NUDIX hydrolase [Pukyongiella litopenaei]AVO36749.1 NUDIX hydrolase [Pukyongiella litopenaei]